MKPQTLQIYKYMMKGNMINRQLAMQLFHCQNLTARISELRDAGIKFLSTTKAVYVPVAGNMLKAHKYTDYHMGQIEKLINFDKYPVPGMGMMFSHDNGYEIVTRN